MWEGVRAEVSYGQIFGGESQSPVVLVSGAPAPLTFD
jgi:hypothetical protein